MAEQFEKTEQPAPAEQPEAETDSEPLTLWEVIGSVLAAAFGVQSDKNRRRDFTRAKPGTYIVAGVIFTALFILVLVLVVRLVLGTVVD